MARIVVIRDRGGERRNSGRSLGNRGSFYLARQWLYFFLLFFFFFTWLIGAFRSFKLSLVFSTIYSHTTCKEKKLTRWAPQRRDSRLGGNKGRIGLDIM